jgi:hypothetical protein
LKLAQGLAVSQAARVALRRRVLRLHVYGSL